MWSEAGDSEEKYAAANEVIADAGIEAVQCRE